MSEVQRGNTVIEAKDLRPGEEILWQSATEPIGLLEGSCGKQIIKSWIITTVITLALVIACTAVIGSIQFKLLAEAGRQLHQQNAVRLPHQQGHSGRFPG